MKGLHAWTTRLVYASIKLKIPGRIRNGSCLACSFSQKHCGQKSGSASAPRFLSQMRRTSAIPASLEPLLVGQMETKYQNRGANASRLFVPSVL